MPTPSRGHGTRQFFGRSLFTGCLIRFECRQATYRPAPSRPLVVERAGKTVTLQVAGDWWEDDFEDFVPTTQK